jgi:hypothetical protein
MHIGAKMEFGAAPRPMAQRLKGHGEDLTKTSSDISKRTCLYALLIVRVIPSVLQYKESY